MSSVRPAPVADSKQTLLCTYLSGILLVGLLLNSLFGWSWADPIVALVIAGVAVREGREAWRGEALLLSDPRAARARGGSSMSEANKAVVRRLVDEVMNGGRLNVLGQLCTPAMAAAARAWIAPFRAAFPDVHMPVVDLVAEDDKVAARFTCAAAQHGDWQGHPATGQRFERVHEVYFFRVRDGRIADAWGLEDNLSRMAQLGFGPALPAVGEHSRFRPAPAECGTRGNDVEEDLTYRCRPQPAR